MSGVEQRRDDIGKVLLDSLARGGDSSAATSWVPLGERAQVRGAIQWDSPVLLPLGANTFLEMANRQEALAWCAPAQLGEQPVDMDTGGGGEVDIREELTVEDIRLIESKGQGVRRIAHVPAIRSTPVTVKTASRLEDDIAALMVSERDQGSPPARISAKQGVQEHSVQRPAALSDVIRERSAPIAERSPVAKPSARTSLFKQSRHQDEK